MSRYVRVATRFWHDEKISRLSENEKFLFLYLLTSPHSNMVGFYLLPKLYACADLNWDQKQFSKAFTKLLEKGFIYYDDTTNVILICNFLKYNPIQNKNQAIGAAKAIKELPSNSLFPQFYQCFQQYAGRYIEPFIEEFPNGFETVTQTVSNTETETETESETESETEEEKTCPNSSSPDDRSGHQKFDAENKPFKLALYLRQWILKNNHRAKVPNKDPTDKRIQDWALEMDRLKRIGPPGGKQDGSQGYDWDEIRCLIDWCQQDSFWKANILSAGKFREQIVQLENQMKREKELRQGKKCKPSNVDNALKLVDKYEKLDKCEEGGFP